MWHLTILRWMVVTSPIALRLYRAGPLFNLYAFSQRRLLHNAREELVRQLIRGEVAEKCPDRPMTEVFNRRYLDEIIPTEVSRAER